MDRVHVAPVASIAEEQAISAATRAGVVIRELATLDEQRAAADLFDQIWQASPPSPPMRIELLRALQHAGNYIAGAFADDRLVGAAAGFRNSERGLHSHIAGVAPEARTRGVGYALKLHQRAWTLRAGLTSITWTFDPLSRYNAYFNLTRLGGQAGTYLPDFYGPRADVMNAGDLTDRLVLDWQLQSAPARVACAGQGKPPPEPDPQTSVVLEEAPDGTPVTRPVPLDATRLACRTPTDALSLRATRTATALAWRHAQRSVLRGALTAGYTITGITRNGYYILELDT